MRLPQAVEPLGIDQGIFATAGWGLSRGLRLYRDVWDQKPPGIHLTYLAGFSIFGATPAAVFWIDLGAAAATALFLFLLVRRSSGAGTGLMTAAVFSLLTLPAARYSFGGFLERSVPETFICPLVAATVWFAVEAGRKNAAWPALAAGVLLGAAATYKPTAIVYWPVLLLASRTPPESSARPVRLGRLALASALGTAVVPTAVTLWLWSSGVLRDAWLAVVAYNRAYVTLGGPAAVANGLAHQIWRLIKTDPLWLAGAAAAVVAAWHWLGRRAEPATRSARLGLVWLAAAFAAAGLNGIRFYNSYFIPALVPLAFLAGRLVEPVFPVRRARRAGFVAIVAVLAGFVGVRSGHVARFVDATSADFGAVRTTPSERIAYLERFGGYANGRGYSARANAELTDYIRTHTRLDDRIYIFGMEPGVYFTSRRLPANRFVWIGPAVSKLFAHDEFRIEALAADLSRSRPRYVVIERHNRDSFIGWTAEEEFGRAPIQQLMTAYVAETTLEDFTLYRLRDGVPAEGAQRPALR